MEQTLNIFYERDVINSYLVIKVDDLTVIREYEVEMLRRNSIDLLLNMNITTLNKEIDIYYNITSKQKLVEILERKKLSYIEVRSFFLHLLTITKDCKRYYLSCYKIIMDPNLIYIKPDQFLPNFIYLPFDSDNIDHEIIKDIANLIEYFVDKVDQDDIDAVMIMHKLITASKQPDFNLKVLQDIIKDDNIKHDKNGKNITDNEKEKKSKEEKNYDIISQLIEFNKKESEAKILEKEKGVINEEERNSTKNKINKNIFKKIYCSFNKYKKGNINKKNIDKNINKYLYYLIIGCIQILTLVLFLRLLKSKILYSDITGNLKIESLLASIIVLLSINIYTSKKTYDYMKINCSNNINKEKDKKPSHNNADVDIINSENISNRDNYYTQVHNNDLVLKEGAGEIYLEATLKQKETIDNITNVSYEETQLLQDYKSRLNSDKKPYLLNKQDKTEKVSISNNPFIIGKLESHVDYIIDNSSISRIHCKIFNKDNNYYIMDLNSKNGTYINKERLISNQQYQIDTETNISISNCEFVFIVE
ncbi:MAG: FHA domain-containing protein [Vallitalea sp.]|jgi:hypothetical protein|nr:FHA domain-containing protein [Vallitalea sp.]